MPTSVRHLLNRAAVPVLAVAGVTGADSRIRPQRATGSASSASAVLIAEANAGAIQEASHSE